jgi:hypothetical protein
MHILILSDHFVDSELLLPSVPLRIESRSPITGTPVSTWHLYLL